MLSSYVRDGPYLLIYHQKTAAKEIRITRESVVVKTQRLGFLLFCTVAVLSDSLEVFVNTETGNFEFVLPTSN